MSTETHQRIVEEDFNEPHHGQRATISAPPPSDGLSLFLMGNFSLYNLFL
jgi:hypothetical protein